VQISVYVLEENPDVTTKQSFVLAWKGSEKNESGRWESVLPRIINISQTYLNIFHRRVSIRWFTDSDMVEPMTLSDLNGTLDS